MLSGLSGLVPSVGAAAKAAVENAGKPAETPAQRTGERAGGESTDNGDKPVAAKTNS